MILVLAMVVSLVPLTAFAQEDGASPDSAASPTNAAGQEASPAAYGGGVSGVTIEDGVAAVSYSAPVAASLVVAIYTEDGSRMLGSGVTTVSAGSATAGVPLEIPQIPSHFVTAAYLLDAQSNIPVSDEWWSYSAQNPLVFPEEEVILTAVGESQQLTVTFLGVDVSSACQWSSSDENVVYASEGGWLYINGTGFATVTATYYNAGVEYSAQCTVNVPVVIDQGSCGDNLRWALIDDGTLMISGTGTMADYSLDNSAGSTAPWKSQISKIKSIDIHSGVTSIGKYAFDDCSNLISVTIPDSVTSIGRSAFDDCSNLISVTIPDSVTSIGQDAFHNCKSLTSVTIPNSVTAINAETFFGCSGLSSITIPDSVTSIGDSAFRLCTSLVTVDIPDSVTNIDPIAFYGCSSLTSITLPSKLTSIRYWTFENCSSLTSITIPNGVTSIGDDAFRNCSSLSFITIPDSVTTLGARAFYECPSLSDVYYSGTISQWKQVDTYYAKLDNATIHCSDGDYGSVKVIASGQCGLNLTWTLDEQGLLTISGTGEMYDYGDGSSYGVAPWYDSVEEIQSVIIENGVTSIGHCAFYGCYKIASASIPNSVTDIGGSSFWSCGSLTSITIPDSVTSIGDCAFGSCQALTSIVIPYGVTSIGYYTFNDCTSLSSITIPDTVSHIGEGAFYDCTSLTSITIPDSVTYIGKMAFYGCTELKDVYYSGTSQEWSQIQIGSENDALVNATIHCSDGEYVPTKVIASGECGENLTWELDNTGTLTISGTGAMKDFGYYSSPWYGQSENIKEVNIQSGVTHISLNAFRGCSKLTSAIIPDSVTSIGINAFEGCYKLADVAIPANVTSIGESAFSGCSMTSVTIPSGITSISDSTFTNCRNLVSVTIPNSVTSIGDSAFSGCSSLANITIPDSVTSIGSSAFNGCSCLTSVTIPKNVTSINEGTFQKCSSLANVSIPNGVTSIGWNAFDGCCSLTSIVIPNSVTSIGGEAFLDCTSLTSVTLSNNITSIRGGSFMACSKLTSVTIPDGVTDISDRAFNSCYKLASVTIPNSVTSISGWAFLYCYELKDVYYNGTTSQWGNISIDDSNDHLFNATIHCTDGDITPAMAIDEEMMDDLDVFEDDMMEDPTEATEPAPEDPTEEPTPTEAPTEKPTEEPTEAPTEEPTETPADPEEPDPEEPEEPAEPDDPDAIIPDELSARTQSVLPAGAQMVEEPTLQLLAAFTGTESNGSGVRSVKFTGLEPGEPYALIVSLSAGSLAPANLQYIAQNYAASDGTLSFTYIPRQDVNAIVQLYGVASQRSITLDRDYITMEVGADSEQILAFVIPEEWIGDLTWEAENPEDTQVISVSDTGKVTAVAPGTAYAVATVNHNGHTLSARCRVDVTQEKPAVTVQSVQLGTDTLTTELYSTQYASFDTVLLLEQNKPAAARSAMRRSAPQNNGVAIESAKFADAATAACFDLVVKDDRTLLVVPKESAIQNPASVKNSYTSVVTVSVCGQEYTTDTTLKLTVKKTMPRLKATALTFNPFFTNQSQAVTITGATVTGVAVDESKATAKAPAIPSWLTLDNGTLTLNNAPKSGSGNVQLLAETEEWAIPIPVTLSARLSYKAPALKLSASSVTIPTYSEPDDGNNHSGSAYLQLQCKNKNDTLESLGVSEIEAPAGWYAWGDAESVPSKDGYFSIWASTLNVTPGKITLKVHFYGTDSVVELPLTVKPQLTPLQIHLYNPDYYKNIKIKLNSAIEDGFFVDWWVGPQYLDLDQYNLFWWVEDRNGNNVTRYFYTSNYDRFYLGTTEDTQPGTYQLLLHLRAKDEEGLNFRTEEPAVIKFTVLPKSAQAGYTAKALDVMDTTFPNPAARIQLTAKNFNIHRILNMSHVITDAKGNDKTNLFDFEWVDGYWTVTPRSGATVPVGSYTLNCSAAMDYRNPDDVTSEFSTRFTVKHSPVRLKLSTTSLTLNRFIGDKATVDVTCQTQGYDFTQPIIKVMDGKGKASAEGCLEVNYENGRLTVATNESTMAGDSYRILVQAREEDAPVTLTVRIPAKTASQVTATLRAKGTIDPIRDGTSVVITPTYRNYMGEAELNKSVRIMASRDGRNYTWNVTSSFWIDTNSDGTYTVTKIPGEQLDTTLKYRFEMSFSDPSISKDAYLALPVRSASARVTLNGSAVLYKQDKYSRNRIPFSIADKTLNQIADVRIKDAKMAALYRIYDYGNGEFAIGFKDNIVPANPKSGSVALEIYFDGNDSDKPNATVTLKVQIK